MQARVLVALWALLPITATSGQAAHTPTSAPVSAAAAAWAQKNLVGWPKRSIAVASDLITRYGLPKDSDARELTLNIADDIIKGDRTVEQALAYHAQVIRGVQIGEPETYPYKLRFNAVPPTADPAEEAPLLKHLGE